MTHKPLEHMTEAEWNAHTGGPDSIITGTPPPAPALLPSWVPPHYPRYRIDGGVAFSCMLKDIWDGDSPEFGDQIYFPVNRGRVMIMEIGEYVIYEFDPATHPFNEDGSFKGLPKMVEVGEIT